MSRTGSAALLLAASLAVGAEPVVSVEQLSAVDRTHADFYGAIAGAGPRVETAWSLSAEMVERGGDVLLTLTVTHATNPKELARPPLTAFRDLFEVVENAGEDATDKSATFRYRLRPRNEGTFTLPLPLYRFYQPRAPEGPRRFQLATSPDLTLTVTPPKPAPPAAAIPVPGPDEFFARPNRAGTWYVRNDDAMAGRYAAILFAVMPLLTLGGIFAYRWLFPDAARRAAIRRRADVRATLRKLGHADAATVAIVLRDYLRTRWLFPAEAQTPGELIGAAPERGFAPEWVAELESLFERTEQARFGSSGSGSNLSSAAESWVLAVEGGRS